MENIIEKVINEEIEKRILEIKSEYDNNKVTIEKQEKLIETLEDENYQLKYENNILKQSTRVEELFIKNFNKDNINLLIDILPYKKIENIGYGMDTDKVHPVFKLIFEYYDDKEEMLTICDKFNIEYPKWFKDYKMPYDYGEKAVDLFIKHLSNAYVCNGCIYENNIGFFYRELSGQGGDEYKLIKYQYHDIPWQLFLKNPLLQQEDVWNKIIGALKGNKNHSYYFYKIDQYQKLDSEKIEQLFNIACESNQKLAEEYISRHLDLLKINKDIEIKFIKNISSEPYSKYHYSLFSKEERNKYLLSLNFYKLVSVLNDDRCNLTEEEKKDIISKSLQNNFEQV